MTKKIKKGNEIPVKVQLDKIILDKNLLNFITQPDPNWKLVRKHDGMTKHSVNVKWIKWTDEGKVENTYNTPAIGRSLIMSPFNQFFTWQTTPIVELIEDTDELIKFRTGNSNYILTKIK